jgi:hypothetical protein
VASLATDRKGRATLSFDVPLDAAQRRKPTELMDFYLGVKN